MNLLDALEHAQGGQLYANLARQLGISEAEVRNATRELMPALTRSLRGNAATRNGLSALLEALASGRHERYVEDPSALSDPATVSEGNAILEHLLGSKRVSRAVAKRANFGSGIGAEILKKLLPYLATILLGMIFKRGTGGSIDLPDLGGAGKGGGGWGDWIGGGGDSGRLEDILGDISRQDRDVWGRSATRDLGPPADIPSSSDNPFGPLSDIVKESAPLPGGTSGRIRDWLGSALGGKSRGITGWIISFIVYRYGWRIVRWLMGRFLGRA